MTVNDKALRLLKQRRVHLGTYGSDYLVGTVLGDTGLRHVYVDPDGPRCDCPAGENHRLCSHVVAVTLLLRDKDQEAYVTLMEKGITP